MSYEPLEKLLDKADGSIYKLVIVSAKRALELAEGAPRLVQIDNNAKPTRIALREIACCQVRYKQPKKAK